MQSGSKKVLQNLFKQKTSGTFCDVQLHLQGTIIWTHACVLASCSSYFMDFLINEDDHWCVRKPLVIAVDKILDDGREVCFICISKIIDFMYLRELVVLKGHFQHFYRIANFLKVLDLLPFCKQYFEKENSTNHLNSSAVFETNNKNVINTLEISQIRCDSSVEKSNALVCNRLDKSDKNEESKMFVDLRNVNEQCNKEETIKSYLETISDSDLKCQETKEIEVSEPTSIQDAIMKNLSSQDNSEIVEVSSSTKSCEFMCCNPDLYPGCEAKQRRKRKISCELCQYSSVSIKKMLKHVQTKKHIKTFCPVCSLSVKNIKDVSQHFQDHYNSKPFFCHICQKRNRFWEYHKLHLRVHCRNKQFHCGICQKSFKHKQNLKLHILSHNYKHVCKQCGYLAPDERTYQVHQAQHSNEESNMCSPTKQRIQEITTPKSPSKDYNQNKFETLKKFQCHICSERFTQKKNLARHTQVKHHSAKEYKCSLCAYLTKRYDLMRDHMKRHHNCLPSEEIKERKRKEDSKLKQECHHKDGIVGVLIPVQLVSVDGSPTLNAFAVKASSKKISENEEDKEIVTGIRKEETESPDSATNDSSLQSQTTQSDFKTVQNSEKGKFQDYVSEPKISTRVEVTESNDKYSYSEGLQNVQTGIEKANDWNCKMKNIGSHFMEESENIWLNEATGELLNSNNVVSAPEIDTEYSADKSHCMNLRTDCASILSSDFEDPFQSLILNEPADTPSFDLDDERQSNPRTPQTNLVDFDSQDNLFTWENLSDNFCSIWVLNETTGELNMVSFGMQPLRLDEHTGSFSFIDDDETALFLNEGTGDLSVIYFNPSKSYCDSSNYFLNDQLNQEKLETLSQHSNDEDDLLNEEFLLASANFMAQDENETFLNELTGEFDVTHYNNFHQETHQVLGNRCMYLNEETGEISWNIIEKNLNNDSLPNADSLRFDFDDSLNCEDFEQFSTEINDFSSQFCLDNVNSNDWHNFDETCDTLLNECTGELIKKC